MRDWYNIYGGWGILFATVTPFPYKVLTIFSGVTHFNLFLFAVISLVGRSLRFFLLAWLLHRFGAPIQRFAEKNLNLMFIIALTLLIGGFAAIRLVF